ncbi:MAG: rod shape-determining protein MreC [Clostridia bacterium]|nr:rod shape-determining protein MreC [Clostridia bacterium]
MKNKWLTTFTLLLIVILSFSVFSFILNKTDSAQFIEKSVNYALTPVQKGVNTGIKKTKNFFTWVFSSSSYIEENEKLKQEITLLEQEKILYEDIKEENKRLRKTLDLKENTYKYDTVVSLVISQNIDSPYDTFKIDKGENDGIKVGDVVIETNALVGKITKTGKNESYVTPIISPEISVSVKTLNSDTLALANSKILLSPLELNLSYLEAPDKVLPGEHVVTSGLGGNFPKGLLVGEVKTVFQKEDKQDGTLLLSADFLRLTEVMVIKMNR